MSVPSLLDVAQLQYKLLFLGSLISILLTFSGVIGLTINLFVGVLLREAKRGSDAGMVTELTASTERPPLGRAIGVLEAELYLYSLLTQAPGIISAVLLFKAFSGWLVTKGDVDDLEAQSHKTLTRFYTYAIGNLVSLLWAVVVFEGLRWSVKSVPLFRQYLWVC